MAEHGKGGGHGAGHGAGGGHAAGGHAGGDHGGGKKGGGIAGSGVLGAVFAALAAILVLFLRGNMVRAARARMRRFNLVHPYMYRRYRLRHDNQWHRYLVTATGFGIFTALGILWMFIEKFFHR